MSGLYTRRQSQRDAEYAAAYDEWVAKLPAKERAKLEAAGVGEADVHSGGAKKTVRNFDEQDTQQLALTNVPEESDPFKQAMAEAISELSHWFVMPPGQRGLNPKAIGCRVIMAMWVMRPDIIGNLSLTEISALVDARPEVLSRQATAFSKKFGIRGRAQFSEKTRKAQRDAKLSRRNAAIAVESAQEPPADPSLN